MYTGQEIYELALACIDQIQPDGTVSTEDTESFVGKSPRLLNLGQSELSKSGSLYGVSEFENTDKYYEWVKYELPSNYKSIKEVIFEINDGKGLTNVNYKTFGENELYVYYIQEGNLRVCYYAIPTKITSLNQALQIDEITATALAWFLAWQFKLANQDDTADEFKQKYESLRRESMIKPPAGFTEIIDYY